MSLHKLEELLNDYSPLMSESTERAVEKGFKYGAVFAEVSFPNENQPENQPDGNTCQLNPVAKAIFGVASVTFEVRPCYRDVRNRGNVRPRSS